MRLLSVKMDTQIGFGIGNIIDHRVAGRMKQHAHVHSVKGAVLGHNDFAAAAFLCRAAKYCHLSAQFVNYAAQRRTGAHGNGTHDIVAAGMPHAFHRIELTENGDIRAFLSGIIHAFHTGFQSANPCFHGKAVFFQQRTHGLAGKILFEIVFRIIPQIIGQPAQLRQNLIHPAADSLLICLHVRPHHFFILGSSTSRTPSPSRLKPSTVIKMNRPE